MEASNTRKRERSSDGSPDRAANVIKGPRGILSEPKGLKKINKERKVSWKEDPVDIRMIEIDPAERVNVWKFPNWWEDESQSGDEPGSRTIEKMPWKAPPSISGLEVFVELGRDSEEKDIQKDREAFYEYAVYRHKYLIPFSPAEPGFEPRRRTFQTIIPWYTDEEMELPSLIKTPKIIPLESQDQQNNIPNCQPTFNTQAATQQLLKIIPL